jgi:DNA-binding NarL/FixJ family response regulator
LAVTLYENGAKQMTTRILILGQGLFCDGLTRLLLDFPSVEIIGAVENCAEARDVVVHEGPEVLIVDHVQVSMHPSELNELMESVDSLKVIFLTLSENKMVVHNRQQLADVTLPVLMQALQITDFVNSSNGTIV